MARKAPRGTTDVGGEREAAGLAQAHGALERLLLEMLTAQDLRQLVTRLPDGRTLAAQLNPLTLIHGLGVTLFEGDAVWARVGARSSRDTHRAAAEARG